MSTMTKTTTTMTDLDARLLAGCTESTWAQIRELYDYVTADESCADTDDSRKVAAIVGNLLAGEYENLPAVLAFMRGTAELVAK